MMDARKGPARVRVRYCGPEDSLIDFLRCLARFRRHSFRFSSRPFGRCGNQLRRQTISIRRSDQSAGRSARGTARGVRRFQLIAGRFGGRLRNTGRAEHLIRRTGRRFNRRL
jgi:hypothetical protein